MFKLTRLMMVVMLVGLPLVASDENNKNVKFSNDEYNLLLSMVSYSNRDDQLEDIRFLATRCGFGLLWGRPDSYNQDEYPQCAKVLEFVKHYKRERVKLEEQFKEFYSVLNSEQNEEVNQK